MCETERVGGGGGGGETHTRKNERQKEKRERNSERQRKKSARERLRERERESERESERKTKKTKTTIRHILCYKMYKTLHGMKHHTQNQSTFSFYLIKPYQPFNQTRTSTTQTTFSPSLCIYSHISHSSQSYGQQ